MNKSTESSSVKQFNDKVNELKELGMTEKEISEVEEISYSLLGHLKAGRRKVRQLYIDGLSFRIQELQKQTATKVSAAPESGYDAGYWPLKQ